jgi:hypothetical protein
LSGNILALRNYIVIDGNKSGKISVGEMCSKIANFLKQRTVIVSGVCSGTDNCKKTEEEQKTFDLILKSLPALQVGLDVNCGFTKYAPRIIHLIVN